MQNKDLERLMKLEKLEELVKTKGRIELVEASDVLNIGVSEVKALLTELVNNKKISGIFTSDGVFVAEEVDKIKGEIDRLNRLAKAQELKLELKIPTLFKYAICEACLGFFVAFFIIPTLPLPSIYQFILFEISIGSYFLVLIAIILYARNLHRKYENILTEIDKLNELLERALRAKGLVKFVSFSGDVKWGTPKQVEKWTRIDLDIQNNFAKLTPRQFEELIAKLLQKMGYQAELTSEKADYGADIIAEKNNEIIVVEVKKWKEEHHVGAKDVRSLIGSMPYFGATRAIFITTSDFTEQAREQAQSVKGASVELWDGYTLRRLIEKYFIEETSNI